MMEVLRSKLEQRVERWTDQIRQNGGKAQIDIALQFEKLFAENLIHISFGEDVNDQFFEIYMMKGKFSSSFYSEKVNLQQAINEVNQQIMNSYLTRFKNPIGMVIGAMTGKNPPPITGFQRQVSANCAALRAWINDYVQKRKRGENQSKVGNKSDLLSLFLDKPDVFTDDFIVDELLDFFLAGVQTTQFASQTMVTHFSKCEQSLSKVRSQFKEALAAAKK